MGGGVESLPKRCEGQPKRCEGLPKRCEGQEPKIPSSEQNNRAARADEERATAVERPQQLGIVRQRNYANVFLAGDAERTDFVRPVEVECQLRPGGHSDFEPFGEIDRLLRFDAIELRSIENRRAVDLAGIRATPDAPPLEADVVRAAGFGYADASNFSIQEWV